MARRNKNSEALQTADTEDIPSALMEEYGGFAKSIKKKGFNLLVAIYNDVPTRKTIIDRISSTHLQTRIIDASSSNTPEIYDFEREIHDSAENSRVLQIINIEYRPDADFVPFLKELNFHRERIALLAPVNLVVWVLEYRVKDLITVAPDLWAWNSGVFTFTIEKEPNQLELLPENIEISELNLQSRRERIRALIEYLSKVLPDNLSEGSKSLIAELNKHVRNIEAYEKFYDFIDDELKALREKSAALLGKFSIAQSLEGKITLVRDIKINVHKGEKTDYNDLKTTIEKRGNYTDPVANFARFFRSAACCN